MSVNLLVTNYKYTFVLLLAKSQFWISCNIHFCRSSQNVHTLILSRVASELENLTPRANERREPSLQSLGDCRIIATRNVSRKYEYNAGVIRIKYKLCELFLEIGTPDIIASGSLLSATRYLHARAKRARMIGRGETAAILYFAMPDKIPGWNGTAITRRLAYRRERNIYAASNAGRDGARKRE